MILESIVLLKIQYGDKLLHYGIVIFIIKTNFNEYVIFFMTKIYNSLMSENIFFLGWDKTQQVYSLIYSIFSKINFYHNFR